jgi:hypothetical protein
MVLQLLFPTLVLVLSEEWNLCSAAMTAITRDAPPPSTDVGVVATTGYVCRTVEIVMHR